MRDEMKVCRSVSVRIGLALVAGLAVALPGCNKQEEAAVPVAADGTSAGSETARAATPPADDSSTEQAELFEQMPSLERVAQALEGAPVNVSIERGEQLEAARAWLLENEPDLSEKERELLAQMILILDDMMSDEEMTLKRMVGVGESQLLQLWAMDADGDGRLSDEEARGQMERWMTLNKTVAEYNSDRFDTDGDGEVSDEEAMAMNELMMENMQPLMATMIERAGLVAWDSDRDGTLTDAEREAGEASLEFTDWDQDGEITEYERMAAYQPLLQDFSQGLVLVEQPDMTEMQAEMQAEIQARMAELQQPGPDRDDFDLDGDGNFTEVELAAFQQEVEAYQTRQTMLGEEMRAAGEGMMARVMQMQFQSAVDALDQDADGLLMNEEWEAGYTDLRGVRDRRMFNYLYDADRSGSVEEPDVARFMDAYDAGSAYADADLDGEVNENDLRRFMDLVTGQ